MAQFQSVIFLGDKCYLIPHTIQDFKDTAIGNEVSFGEWCGAVEKFVYVRVAQNLFEYRRVINDVRLPLSLQILKSRTIGYKSETNITLKINHCSGRFVETLTTYRLTDDGLIEIE